jgi:carbon monoxide dehydrogenase subunit G
VNAPRDEVFGFVREPTKPSGGNQGCQDLTETGEGDYAATLTARISFLQLTFEGIVRFEGVEPYTRFAARATVTPTTPAGKLNEAFKLYLGNQGSNETLTCYAVCISIAGKLGRIEQSASRAESEQMAYAFASNVEAAAEGLKVTEVDRI